MSLINIVKLELPVTTQRQLGRIDNNAAKAINILEKLMIDTTSLTAAVARIKTVDESILALVKRMSDSLKDLAKQLADAIANNDPAEIARVQKDIADSADALNADADNLAAAVTANTPAEPPAPPAA